MTSATEYPTFHADTQEDVIARDGGDGVTANIPCILRFDDDSIDPSGE